MKRHDLAYAFIPTTSHVGIVPSIKPPRSVRISDVATSASSDI